MIRKFIVCFENPVLCTESQKETSALLCFLCFTAFGRKTKPPVSRVVVYFKGIEKRKEMGLRYKGRDIGRYSINYSKSGLLRGKAYGE